MHIIAWWTDDGDPCFCFSLKKTVVLFSWCPCSWIIKDLRHIWSLPCNWTDSSLKENAKSSPSYWNAFKLPWRYVSDNEVLTRANFSAPHRICPANKVQSTRMSGRILFTKSSTPDEIHHDRKRNYFKKWLSEASFTEVFTFDERSDTFRNLKLYFMQLSLCNRWLDPLEIFTSFVKIHRFIRKSLWNWLETRESFVDSLSVPVKFCIFALKKSLRTISYTITAYLWLILDSHSSLRTFLVCNFHILKIINAAFEKYSGCRDSPDLTASCSETETSPSSIFSLNFCSRHDRLCNSSLRAKLSLSFASILSDWLLRARLRCRVLLFTDLCVKFSDDEFSDEKGVRDSVVLELEVSRDTPGTSIVT